MVQKKNIYIINTPYLRNFSVNIKYIVVLLVYKITCILEHMKNLGSVLKQC